MGYDHVTVGWEQFDKYVEALQEAHFHPEVAVTEELDDQLEYKRRTGPEYCLRLAQFTNWEGVQMIVEEVVVVRDHDCDGVSLVGVLVYPEGKRPSFTTQEIHSG